MRFRTMLQLACILLSAAVAFADRPEHDHAVVMDLDMGIDDAVALATALQHPDVDLAAIVVTEGVAGGAQGVESAGRMLDLFNRKDVTLFGPVESGPAQPPPPFRAFAEQALARALADRTKSDHRPFSPGAYVVERKRTAVWVLGPFTNLAAALEADPKIAAGIDHIVVAGKPDPKRAWNIRYDPEAWKTVSAAGIPLRFVIAGPAGRKPDRRRQGEWPLGRGNTIGEGFLVRLLADSQVREHYTGQLGSFHDELVVLQHVAPALFLAGADRNVFAPRDHDEMINALSHCWSSGRLHKERVVFVDEELPDACFRDDIRVRRAALVAKNGDDEWFAQVLMNEVHEHLGAYSIIGVKMGIRAAELLNAPRHAISVLSHTATEPPISCINDGVIVATGSTPGRGLFHFASGPANSLSVDFTFNGECVRLALKEEYRRRIGEEFMRITAHHTLEDAAYWEAVRRFGLDVWENWHRRELFTVDRACALLPGG